MTQQYSAREAIQKALQKSVRYARLGYCQRCDELHTEVHHLDSVTLIAEEVYLWLGYGPNKTDLKLFGRLVKILEDAPVTGQRDRDIPDLAERLMDAARRRKR